jgi:hypothetical protein
MAKPDPRGVPLRFYRQHDASVRIYCRDCALSRDLDLEAVIERLEVRGVGGAHTGIVELADLLRTPCERCRGRRFTTAPAFRSADRRG